MKITSEDGSRFIARDDAGRWLGCLLFSDGQIRQVEVVEEHRREGVATALMDALIRTLPPGTPLWVVVNDWNGTEDFFRQLGFRVARRMEFTT